MKNRAETSKKIRNVFSLFFRLHPPEYSVPRPSPNPGQRWSKQLKLLKRKSSPRFLHSVLERSFVFLFFFSKTIFPFRKRKIALSMQYFPHPFFKYARQLGERKRKKSLNKNKRTRKAKEKIMKKRERDKSY